MIEFTLYGQMYGMPIVRMSVWPSHLDELLAVDVLGRDLVDGLDLAGTGCSSSGAAPRCRGRSCGRSAAAPWPATSAVAR